MHPTRVLNGRQMKRKGTVLQEGQINHAQRLLIKKPQMIPTTIMHFGRFRERTALAKTSIAQVIKLVRQIKINLPFVNSKTEALSVKIPIRISERVTTEIPISMTIDIQYSIPIPMVFLIRSKLRAPKF